MIEAEPKKKFETKLAHPTYVIEEWFTQTARTARS
jgi:hypothetical protein